MDDWRWAIKDELVSVGALLVVAATGSFFWLNQMTNSRPMSNGAKSTKVMEQVLGATQSQTGNDLPVKESEAMDVGGESLPSPSPRVSPSPSPTPNPTPRPTPAIDRVELIQASEEMVNDDYQISFSNPRMSYGDANIFRVEVVLANKGVAEGLHNRLQATVVKDGTVLINEAAMSNSEVVMVMPGEQITYTASLSLVEETEVSRVSFNPGEGLARAVFSLE